LRKAGERDAFTLLLADEVVVTAAAAATITTEPVMTTRLTTGDTVKHAPAGGRAAQTGTALLTTGVVVRAGLINSSAQVERVHLVPQH